MKTFMTNVLIASLLVMINLTTACTDSNGASETVSVQSTDTSIFEKATAAVLGNGIPADVEKLMSLALERDFEGDRILELLRGTITFEKDMPSKIIQTASGLTVAVYYVIYRADVKFKRTGSYARVGDVYSGKGPGSFAFIRDGESLFPVHSKLLSFYTEGDFTYYPEDRGKYEYNKAHSRTVPPIEELLKMYQQRKGRYTNR